MRSSAKVDTLGRIYRNLNIDILLGFVRMEYTN